MMKLIIGIMAAAAVLASTSAWSQEVGRYQVIVVPWWSTLSEDDPLGLFTDEQVEPVFRDAALMLDTATGDTWVLLQDGMWHQVMEITDLEGWGELKVLDLKEGELYRVEDGELVPVELPSDPEVEALINKYLGE